MNPLLRTVVLASAAAVLAGAALSSCQSYDADAVKPWAIKSVNMPKPITGVLVKPKIMIVVDRSGSMMDSVSGTGGSCSKNNVYDPTSTSDCKWKNLLDAFAGTGGMLPNMRGMAYFGLAAFPGTTSDACSTGVIVVPVSDASDNVDAITSALQNTVSPGGGTPTATTLQTVAADPSMVATSSSQLLFAMLLTDGMPNCNRANQSTCETCKAGCSGGCSQCALAPCSATFAVVSNTDCAAQNPCLDGDNTVAAVQALANAGIKTFVIGFGQDTGTGSAADILNRAAVAGGLARDASSGGTQFYQASSKDELKTALQNFERQVTQGCSWTLDPAPTSDEIVEVVKSDAVAGTTTVLVKDTDFTVANGSVTLSDALCAEVQSAPADRYTYDFRYVADL